MLDYQREFLDFAIDQGVLRFGEFTLKSGRSSPYFFNAGLFNSGLSLARIGRFYAAAIIASGIKFDMLFGPAYKGIPLACAAAIALADHHQSDLPWAFNRKEIKNHGEGGNTVGAPLQGRVLLIDDVITAGTAIRESMALLTAAGAEPAGVVVALDRQEKGQGKRSAIQEVEQTYNIPVAPIVRLDHLLAYLRTDPQYAVQQAAVSAYQQRYGVTV